MAIRNRPTYHKHEATTWSVPNGWDLLAMVAIFTLLFLLAWSAKQMVVDYQLGDPIPIQLNPLYLPKYALRTTLRLFIALFFSLISALVLGNWAAKSRKAERVIIPTVDVLQSVPVLSFLSITVTGFLFIFKNSMLGPECAAIFGIFTSQVWNMILGFYQGVQTVPKELKEAARVFRLSGWQRFWRVEVPFAMPGLLWNTMMSMSASWFFVIACEAFSVAGHDVTLPGVGSYIALAIAQADKYAVIYAVVCMLCVIFLYDQLLFRPLVYWTEKFKEPQEDEERVPKGWLVEMFQRTKLLRCSAEYFERSADLVIGLPRWKISGEFLPRDWFPEKLVKVGHFLALLGIGIAMVLVIVAVWRSVFVSFSWLEVRQVVVFGLFTTVRVMSLILLSVLVWLPIGVWIGLRPRVSAAVQPAVQFLAAFPANLLFPVVTILIINYHLNVEIWVAPLMVLGTQWYVLFNVIAGTAQLSKELKLAVANFRVRGWLRWRRFILPGIAPSLITGAITAAGGAWNASIVAETVSWGGVQLHATGLGAYIHDNFAAGDFSRVALGTVVMCALVLLINRLFWRPLYNMAVELGGGE